MVCGILSNSIRASRIVFLGVFMVGLYTTGLAQSKPIQSGEKIKMKGRIAQREADGFILKDETGATIPVVLTDSTSVKSKKRVLGIFPSGEEHAVTSLLPGLLVEVEGRGNRTRQIVAEKIRFDESDLKTAMTVDTRVGPVEEATRKVAGQVEEIGTIANDARTTARNTDARVSNLDNFDEKSQATVYFALNSYVLSSRERQQLDVIAKDALNSSGYIVEVTGFADPTGDKEKNIALSQRRADAVAKYLAINGNIPMRRIITPIGYGATRSSAQNNTTAGRRLERRVEVRLLINRGLAQH